MKKNDPYSSMHPLEMTSMHESNDTYASDASIDEPPKFTKKQIDWLNKVLKQELRVRPGQIAEASHLYEQWLYHQGTQHAIDTINDVYIKQKQKR